MMMLDTAKGEVEGIIEEWLEGLSCPDTLNKACRYALTTGGKRFRPLITLKVAEGLGLGHDVRGAALAVELFHTASLVADDLPCMDDDDQRRNRPSLHKVFGEAVAMLVSYGLISAGYECLYRNAALANEADLPGDRLCVLALENVTYNTGLAGATGGQFSDIFVENLTESVLRDVVRRKTGTLYEVAFVLGWLFGGGNPQLLPRVKEAAHFFGLAFQVADDLKDMDQDASQERSVNYATLFGKERAIDALNEALTSFDRALTELGLGQSELTDLSACLRASLEK